MEEKNNGIAKNAPIADIAHVKDSLADIWPKGTGPLPDQSE